MHRRGGGWGWFGYLGRTHLEYVHSCQVRRGNVICPWWQHEQRVQPRTADHVYSETEQGMYVPSVIGVRDTAVSCNWQGSTGPTPGPPSIVGEHIGSTGRKRLLGGWGSTCWYAPKRVLTPGIIIQIPNRLPQGILHEMH